MLNDLLLGAVIGWMLTGTLTAVYIVYKTVTTIIKKLSKLTRKHHTQ